MLFFKICGIILFVACKKQKRRGYNILKIKRKSTIIDLLTKETKNTFKIMTIGFIIIIAILSIKYKTVYEVRIGNETLGYVKSKEQFVAEVNNKIINKTGNNIDNVSLDEELQYEFKLIKRSIELNDSKIINELANNHTITTYKYYAVVLNGKSETYVSTIDEAQKVVNDIKDEYDGNGLDLNLSIDEVYTENENAINTGDINVAETTISNEVEVLIEEKEAREAIAKVNGINLSVLPVSGSISSRYNDVSSIRGYAPHTGVDIVSATGTDIKVVAKGTVLYAGWHHSYGNIVKIDHGNGVQTWYAHCSRLYVSQGQTVKAGDVIAAVGSTGNSTGPHLHFEIRINGNPVNPQIYVYK